ncbi:hypothetical protein Tco_0873134 [Tanacetum coccineum]
MPRKKINVLAQHLQEIMEELLHTMVDDRFKELTKTQVLKTSEHGTFVFGESSSGQDFESEPDDDEIPTEKVSQELVVEMSHTVDEAKLRKVKGSSGLEKIVISLYKFPAVIFLDDDIEERTSRWIDKSTVIWERVHDFQLDVASEWFKKDCISSVTTWENLVEKFIKKFYQHSDNHEEIETDDDDEPYDIAKIFKIEDNLFDYETPLCKAFNEFNYLLKINTGLFTFEIQEIKTYEDYDSNINGFCNGGELPGMVRVGCMTYFQDHKWYDDMTDGKLKEEALMHKARIEESWGGCNSQSNEILSMLSKVEGCGGLGGSRLTWGDKEVTMQYLELKGGDRGACKLLGDVIEVLG